MTSAPPPGGTAAPYPILLAPIYKEKVWGGRRFERLGRTLPGDADTRWGESWEVADLASTAPSGGGGDPARSMIANGPLAGRTLGDLVAGHGPELLGEARPSDDGGFPLLVKYLDAREDLSVQVHPSPAYAARHPEARLKSEAWYVVDAEPGAVIYGGLVPGTTAGALERAIRDGDVPRLLRAIPAVPGEAHYLPSGTCHALGAGVLVAEVQTPSDTTFRVYDWGRTDRELHVRQALESIDFAEPAGRGEGGPAPPEPFSGDVAARALVRCPHFGVDEWRLEPGAHAEVRFDRPEVWMVIGGTLALGPTVEPFEAVEVATGTTVLLPGSLRGVAAEAAARTRMLRITIPADPAR